MKIDILTVKEELAHRGKLEESGRSVRHHATEQQSSHLRPHRISRADRTREISAARNDTWDSTNSSPARWTKQWTSPTTLMDAHNLLDRLEGEFGHNDHMRDMDALMTATMDRSRTDVLPTSVNGVTGIPTGLADLDRMTSGLAKRRTQ